MKIPFVSTLVLGAFISYSQLSANTLFYQNPLQLSVQGARGATCADPSAIKGQKPGDPYWYIYSTTAALTDSDRNSDGSLRKNLIPTYRSLDLVHWEYVNNVFDVVPSWAAPDTFLFAPDILYFNGQYYLYFEAGDTVLPGGGSAVGVAISDSPTGPWRDSGKPVVEPHPGLGTGTSPRWTYDPEVVQAYDGSRYIYFGSYFGGISVRALSADGLSSSPLTESQITIPNRYEAANVLKHNGYYYLLASATNCCNGALTGYCVFAGRSTSPRGPFVDREGNTLLQSRVGGTPVLANNGNRWVGGGHTYVITDFQGQDWMVYAAMDRNDPFFSGLGILPGTIQDFVKRQGLIDRLDWVQDWPTVRGGFFASDSPQLAPAAQPGERRLVLPVITYPEALDSPVVTLFEDRFNGSALRPGWSWIRDPGTTSVQNGSFVFPTQAADLHPGAPKASVLTRELPPGDVVIETKLRNDVPVEGFSFNFAQGGLLFYGDDDNYIKLSVTSIFETRQTEFGKQIFPVPPAYPNYGNAVGAAPADATWLRVIRRMESGEERYTAYTSQDGRKWVRGSSWTHQLGNAAKLGLISFGASGFTNRFEYVRIGLPVTFQLPLTLR